MINNIINLVFNYDKAETYWFFFFLNLCGHFAFDIITMGQFKIPNIIFDASVSFAMAAWNKLERKCNREIAPSEMFFGCPKANDVDTK